MTDLVIDASVAMKWVIEEHGTREAMSLRRHRLFAPELLVAECASVLWKKTRRRELTPDEARLAARLLAARRCRTGADASLARAATELAIAMDHPAYDCAYLALAESLSCDLVTADRKLSAKPVPIGYKSRVLGLTTSALP